MDFSDWLYLAVKSGKRLTAREIRGKKKHKILWCLRDLKGVCCGGQCPFCFGLYLGKMGRGMGDVLSAAFYKNVTT